MLSVQFSMQSIYVCVVLIITTNNKNIYNYISTLYKHTNCNTRYKNTSHTRLLNYDEYFDDFGQ